MSATPSHQAETIYFDFVRKRVLVAAEEQPIRDGQPERLVEFAVRYGEVNIMDTFVNFDEWRFTREEFDPKRRLQVVISRANKLLKPFGLALESSETAENTYALQGWDDARHKSNAGEATVKLRSAFEAMRNRTISREIALTTALEAFGLDPESLPCAFFIVECLRKLGERTVSNDLLRSMNRLLRRRQYTYEDAIAAIVRCDAMQTDSIRRRLSGYESTLGRIRRRRRVAQTLVQWREICEDEGIRIGDIVQHIRAIRGGSKSGHDADQTKHLQMLLNSSEMRTAKRAVVSKIMNQCPRNWRDHQSMQVEFDSCFAELIQNKVDCAKLRHAGSFTSYVKKTIPSMLLERAYQDVHELSYSQFKAVQRLRKAIQAIRRRSGHEPSDGELTQELKIKGRRLRHLRQWEQKLTALGFDDDRDGNSADEDVFSSY